MIALTVMILERMRKMNAEIERIVDALLQRGDTPESVAAALGLRDRTRERKILAHRPGRRRRAPYGRRGRGVHEN